VCSYGRAPGPNLTVFAAKRGGAEFYASQKRAAEAHGSNPRSLTRAGHQAFGMDAVAGPTVQTFFLLKHGQYVNVLLYNAPPGATDLLASEAASAIP
jgi:hypothetical protein